MIGHVPILRNAELNRRLFDDGFVTMPFLTGDEIDALTKLFYQFHTDEEVEGLYVSAVKKDAKSVQAISDSIRDLFRRAITEHIENGVTLGGTFITKPAHQTEALEPHQDWSIVDESRFRSFTIWVPLVDVNDDNGAMYVLPGSHDSMRGYRHLTIPSIFGQIYEHVWPQMKPIHLKAGEAIIFDHALGHASKPNRTNQIRIAATHSLISPNFEMRFYWNNNGTVEEFEGESHYYNTEQAKVGPGNLKKLRDLDFKIHQLDREEFNTLVGAEIEPELAFQEKRSWFQKIFG